MLVCKKTKACFLISTLVLGLSASNISCSANPVNKGLIKQAQKKSFSNTKLKSNSEVKGTQNNFLNKIKILAKEKPEAILLPAGIFLAALFTATFLYHVRKKNLQELPNNNNAEEEKSTDVTQNFEPDDGKENDSSATKKTNEKDDADRKGDVSQDEKASIKGTPTKTNLEKDDNSKTCEKDVNTSKEKSINEKTSPEKASYNNIMYYTKIAKWWCFWSVLLFSYFLTLSGILTVIFFPELFSFTILWNIFGFLAPFLTFCVDPILNILNIPYFLKVFLERAMFTFFALIFTVADFAFLTDFTYKNACLIVKGKDTLLTPWWYIFSAEVLRQYEKHKEKVDFKQFIDKKYAELKYEHKNRLIETYKALNGVESKK